MPKRSFLINDFSGGLDQDKDPSKLEDNQLHAIGAGTMIKGGSVQFASMANATYTATTGEPFNATDTNIYSIGGNSWITDYMAILGNTVYRGTGLYKWGEDILHSNAVDLTHSGTGFNLGGLGATSEHSAGTGTGFNVNVFSSYEDVEYVWLGKGASTFQNASDANTCCKLGYVDTSSGSITYAQGNKYGVGAPTYDVGMEFQNPLHRFIGAWPTHHSGYHIGENTAYWGFLHGWYFPAGQGMRVEFRQSNGNALQAPGYSPTGFALGGNGEKTENIDGTAHPHWVLGDYITTRGWDMHTADHIRMRFVTTADWLSSVYFRLGNVDTINASATGSDNSTYDTYNIFKDRLGMDLTGKDMYFEFSLNGTHATLGTMLDNTLLIMIMFDCDPDNCHQDYDDDSFIRRIDIRRAEIASHGQNGEKIRMRIPLETYVKNGSNFQLGNVKQMSITYWGDSSGDAAYHNTGTHLNIYEVSFAPSSISSWTNKDYILHQSKLVSTPVGGNELETLPITYGGTVVTGPNIYSFDFQVYKSTDGSNGNIYWQESDDTGSGKGSKFLLAEVDDTDGVKPANSDSFIPWDTDKVKFTMSESPVSMTYSLNSGYPQGTEYINAEFKHSAVVGRTAYIGNVKQNSDTFDGSLILKSAIGKPYGFSDKTYIDIETGGDDGITAMLASGDRLFVFTSAKLVIINVAQDFEYMEGTFEGWGIHRRSSVCQVDEGIAFISNSRDVVYFNGSAFEIITDKGLKSETQLFGDSGAFDPLTNIRVEAAGATAEVSNDRTAYISNYARVGAIFFDPKLRTINVYDYTSSCYQMYSLQDKVWIGKSIVTPHSNWTNAVPHIDSGGGIFMLFGTSGNTLKYWDVSKNATTNTGAYMRTKFYDVSGSRNLKKLHKIRINGRNWVKQQGMELTIYRDGDYTTWIGDNSTLSPSSTTINTSFPTTGNDTTWETVPSLGADNYGNSVFRTIAFNIQFGGYRSHITRIDSIEVIYSDISLDNEGKEGSYS